MTRQWTTADFDTLTWHDCHVHGFRLGTLKEELGSADLILDIDFIVEWLPQADPISGRMGRLHSIVPALHRFSRVTPSSIVANV